MPVLPATEAPSPEPMLSWLTAPLLSEPSPSYRRNSRHSKLDGKRSACGPYAGHRWHAAAEPGASTSAKSVSGASASGVFHPTTCVTVPAAHVAWLTAAAWRYNDGTSGAALNKTARNAIEFAAAVLSVDTVLATAVQPLTPTTDEDGCSTDAWSDADSIASGGTSVERDAVTAPPAGPVTVRLTSTPLRFLEAVAEVGGVRCVADAFGLVLAAVRAMGGNEVFTTRWGRDTDTASVYADLGVFDKPGEGILW